MVTFEIVRIILSVCTCTSIISHKYEKIILKNSCVCTSFHLPLQPPEWVCTLFTTPVLVKMVEKHESIKWRPKARWRPKSKLPNDRSTIYTSWNNCISNTTAYRRWDDKVHRFMYNIYIYLYATEVTISRDARLIVKNVLVAHAPRALTLLLFIYFFNFLRPWLRSLNDYVRSLQKDC